MARSVRKEERLGPSKAVAVRAWSLVRNVTRVRQVGVWKASRSRAEGESSRGRKSVFLWVARILVVHARAASRVRCRISESLCSSVVVVAFVALDMARWTVRLGPERGMRTVLMLVWNRCKMLIAVRRGGR